MTRTPDEIKRGLEYHGWTLCDKDCPYGGFKGSGYDCSTELCGDALILIQQFEAQNAEQAERIQQLEAERDAAVKDLLIGPTCETCLHHDKGRNDSPCDACVENTIDYSGLHWQWRGVQKEDGNA